MVKIVPELDKTSNRLILSFKYDEKTISLIKKIEGRKYHPDKKYWSIPVENYDKLLNILASENEIDISLLVEMKEYLKEKIEEYIDENFINTLKIKPFKHQIEAANFLLNKKRAILADEMGGGKTLSSIIASKFINGTKLVICPATLKLNWEKEILQTYDTTIKIVNGKTDTIENNYEWIIINYNILEYYVDILKEMNIKVVIIDEAHYIKSVTNGGKPSSKRGKATIDIANSKEFVFVLTGTPITNKTKDVFNLLKCIKHPLSQNFFKFAMKYCDGKQTKFGWDFNGSSNLEDLNIKLKKIMLRRLKKDLLDLPPKLRSFIPVEIDLKLYNEKLAEYMSVRDKLNSQNEHLIYLNAMKLIIAKEKLPYTFELVDDLLEQNESVVVFTCYKEVIKAFMERYKNDIVKIDGEMNIKERQKSIEEFQSGNKKIIVANIIAAGVGISLIKSKYLIFNDYDWTPANHSQAEDRINRIGQTRTTNIYYVYAKNATIDNYITNIIEKKLKTINRVVDGIKEGFLDQIENVDEDLIKNIIEMLK